MKKTWLVFLVFLLHFSAYGQSLPIIPLPVEAKLISGDPFILTKKTPFFFISGRAMANVIEFNALLKKTYGYELTWTNEILDSNQKFIYLALPKDSTIPDEGYKLLVNSHYIKATATSRSGLFYALVSVLQMMQPTQDGDGAFTVPACEITDYPRFKWRGMHLDVCRHFFGKEFIKKYIDLLALHKMNTFHWHLTEDQGWRIQIKKYPWLTEIGGWRSGSMVGRYSDHNIDTVRYGGFYTQEDIQEIVKYAASRHVTIIPEIEMPGHALAALAAYPSLSCTGGPFDVAREWGVFDDVYCAGNENTFTFIEDVLTEVCALFPGKYIHIGGDECPKERWKTCPKCQKRIKDEGLKDEHELQSYFIRRIEKFLNSKGKQIIGWDEILEGGLAPNAAVMSWRGEEGGIQAANQQHNVVMSPGTHCYFDHYQGEPDLEPIAIGGYTTVEKVYGYDPVPAALHDSLSKYIMGAQGNVWTEYILNEKQVEYMAFPRTCALAEVLWSPKEKRDQLDFMRRLQHHLTLLEKWKVGYARSMYQVKFATHYVEISKNPASRVLGIEFQTSTYPAEIEVYIQYMDGKSRDTSATLQLDAKEWPDWILLGSATIRVRITGENSFNFFQFYLSKCTGKPISFSTLPHKNYRTNIDYTLVNGVKGEVPRRNDQWLAWQGEDVEMTIDLLSPMEIEQVEIGYLQHKVHWIYLPKEITIAVSTNGKKYKNIRIINGETIQQNPRQLIVNFEKQKKIRYVKITAKNAGKVPEGNQGAGEDSWLFFDEILIN